MTGRIIIADARKVSASDFHKLFEPRESELDKLLGQLWTAAVDNDRDRIAELHVQIKALRAADRGDWTVTVRENADGRWTAAA